MNDIRVYNRAKVIDTFRISCHGRSVAKAEALYARNCSIRRAFSALFDLNNYLYTLSTLKIHVALGIEKLSGKGIVARDLNRFRSVPQ